MVRAIIAVAALALAGSASAAKNDTKMYVGKLAVLEELSNKTDSIKDEAWELAAMKLNKTMHIADKVFEYKNKTEKALNLSKFEAHVDAKFDMLVDALNETKAKVDEPVKMVDEKVDLLKAELEEKLAMLKNKTFGIKEEVAGKLEELLAFKAPDAPVRR